MTQERPDSDQGMCYFQCSCHHKIQNICSFYKDHDINYSWINQLFINSFIGHLYLISLCINIKISLLTIFNFLWLRKILNQMSYASKAKYRYESLQISGICMVWRFCSHFTLLKIWNHSSTSVRIQSFSHERIWILDFSVTLLHQIRIYILWTLHSICSSKQKNTNNNWDYINIWISYSKI